MALYVPLDVDFATDPKFLAAGPLAGYLYISSLALCKRTMVDGVVERPQLVAIALGLPGKPETHAQKLVEVGLWAETKDGWKITGWLKRNPSRAQILDKQAKKKESAEKANHDRWHIGGKTSPSCRLCDPVTDPKSDRSTDESGLQTKEKEEPKEEAAAAVDGSTDPRVDVELADRLARRRRKGEDIGPPLAELIRQDVIRDLALQDATTGRLAVVRDCATCADLGWVANPEPGADWTMPCPSCAGSVCSEEKAV